MLQGAWHTASGVEIAGKERDVSKVIRLLGLLALILAGIIWWWVRDGAQVDSGEPVAAKSIGTSTLNHGSNSPPASAGRPSTNPSNR
jgi:hypothetical protein